MCEVCNHFMSNHCPVCGKEMQICQTCNGEGRIFYKDEDGDVIDSIYDMCPTCGGIGYVDDDEPDYWDDDERYQLMYGK